MATYSLPAQRPLQERLYRHRSLLLSVLAFVSIFILILPALWLFLTSLKTNENIFQIPPQWLPNPITLDNYTQALRAGDFGRYLANSLLIASVSTVVCVFISAMSAYALTFFNFRGRRLWMSLIVGTQFFPAAILLLPLFRMWAQVGLFNTYFSLIATYVATALSLCTWLLIGFYRAIPVEVLDAATIDGCDRLGLFLRIVLPLSLPGILAGGAYIFIGVWQEFLLAVTLIGDPELRTVMVGLYTFITQNRVVWNLLIAASVAVSVPTIVIFGLVQRYIVDGLTAGAVK